MPSKGDLTLDKAMKQGYVPAAPIARVIDNWARENWWMDEQAMVTSAQGRNQEEGATGRLGNFVGLSQDTITRIRGGKKEWVEFDNADKIVTFIDPFLWHRDPELSDIYQNFDFSHLDLTRPTCDDGLSELDFLPSRQVAAIYGVSHDMMNRTRRKKKEAA